MHICISELTRIDSDNGLLPDQHQATSWTNAGVLLIGPLATALSEICIEIHTFNFKKMYLKMSSRKWRPFCLSLNMLIDWWYLCRSSIKYITRHTANTEYEYPSTPLSSSVPVNMAMLLFSTHWGREKLTTNFLTMMSYTFFWMKIFKLGLRFHWNYSQGPN